MFKVIHRPGASREELLIDRLYLNNTILEIVCPYCSRSFKHDLGIKHLSFPKVGTFQLDCECPFENRKCKWQESATLYISILPNYNIGIDITAPL